MRRLASVRDLVAAEQVADPGNLGELGNHGRVLGALQEDVAVVDVGHESRAP
jgi:hypothetical protein